MDIILLSGTPNSGKTTTLNLVYDELVRDGAQVLHAKTQVGGNPADFECVLVYGGKSIAIFTMGDYLMHCCFAVVRYAACDKLILAYSTKFKQDLENVVSGCNNHAVVLKTIGNPAASNQKDAGVVLAKINA